MPAKKTSPPGRILNIKLQAADNDRIEWLMAETGAITAVEVIRAALKLATDVESGRLRYKVTLDRRRLPVEKKENTA